MSRIVVGLVFLISLPTLSVAQTEEKDRRRQGYVVGAVGMLLPASDAWIQLGGGMDWLVHEGVGLGFEGSYMGYADCWCEGGVLGFINASYHFLPHSRAGRLDPFLVAGMGELVAGNGGLALVNIGGGFNVWSPNGRALRLEVRDYMSPSGGHVLSLRVGVTF